MDDTTVRQVTLRELLEDPIYRKWFMKPPEKKTPSRWRVYAQKTEGGPWSKADFITWGQAYHFVRRHHKQWYDAALCSRVWEWRPPVIRVRTERQVKGRWRKVWVRNYYEPMVNMIGHVWCPHCRRPTVFRQFKRHHNVGKALVYKPRCTICGIALSAVKQYKVREEDSGA
jgi:hypothetical protein